MEFIKVGELREQSQLKISHFARVRQEILAARKGGRRKLCELKGHNKIN